MQTLSLFLVIIIIKKFKFEETIPIVSALLALMMTVIQINANNVITLGNYTILILWGNFLLHTFLRNSE